MCKTKWLPNAYHIFCLDTRNPTWKSNQDFIRENVKIYIELTTKIF